MPGKDTMTRFQKKVFGAAVLAAALAGSGGGCASFRPIPGPGRDGGLYRYTADYEDEELPFALCGKALIAEADHNWALIPLALFPGYPLYAAERYVLCPVVDTALVPYDLALKLWEGHVCAHKGLKVVLVDGAERPVPGCEIAVVADARSGRRIVYGGKPCPPGYFATCVTTDGKGEAYVPIDMGTCETVRLEGWAWTADGKEDFRAQARGGWDWASERLDNLEKTGEGNRIVLKLKGRFSRAEVAERWPEGTLFAEGTDPADFLPGPRRSLGHELETQWATLEVPGKVDGFDEAWDADAAAMRGEWHGEVEVEAMPELCTSQARFSRVGFDIGGRRVAGWLSEPMDGVSGAAAPMLAFFARGPDPDPATLTKPKDRTVLYLSAFEPGYDYRRGEWAVLEKYGLSWGIQCDAYAIDGIDEGCEAYFFHPVLSGALRAAEWLADRTGASRIRCAGTDQGAALALMTAALSPRVGSLEVHHPVFVDLMDGRGRAWPQFHWHERSGRMDEARRWMPYYELCSFAGRVRCPVTLWLNLRETPAVASLAVFRSLPAGSGKRLVFDNSLAAADALRVLVSPEAPLAAARSLEPVEIPQGGTRVPAWKTAMFAGDGVAEARTPPVPEGVQSVVLPVGKGRWKVSPERGGAASVGVGIDPMDRDTVVWNAAGTELWRHHAKRLSMMSAQLPAGTWVWNGMDVMAAPRPMAGVLAWDGADVAIRPKGWKKGAAVEVFAWTLDGYGEELARRIGEAVDCGTNAVCFEAEADGGWWRVRWDAWPDAPVSDFRFYALAVREDTDGDGLDDGREAILLHTDPTRCDSDADTRDDGLEAFLGSNPLQPFLDTRLAVNAFWTDPDGAGGSWVELRSSAPRGISLQGFRLETARDGAWRTVLAFPDGLSIPPGGSLLIGEKGVAGADLRADLDFPPRWPAQPVAGVRLVRDGAPCVAVADAVIVGRGDFPEQGGLDRAGWESHAGVRPKGAEPLVRHRPDVDNNRTRDWTTRAGYTGRSAKAPLDSDGDGLSDADELSGRLNQPWGEPTNPFNPDSDGDGLSDYDECCIHHTNPDRWDTDGDIWPWGRQGAPAREWPGSDPWEIEHGWNPLVADENANGIPDGQEMALGSEALPGGADSVGNGNSGRGQTRTGRDPQP